VSVTEFLRPSSTQQTLELLAQRGDDAKIVAGGQSLAVLLRMGLVQASALVGLDGLSELGELRAADGELHVGARVTHQRVQAEPDVRHRWTVLAEATAAVSTPQVRNQGTVCGNVAHAYPLADPPAALLALGARAHVRSASGERIVPLDAFFVDVLTTVLEPTELLTHLTVPAPVARSGGAYEVFRLRALDYPTIGVAVQLALDADGRCAEARVALNGAAATPMRARRAETALIGQPADEHVLKTAGAEAAAEADPSEDVDGSVAYKRRLVAVLLQRAARRAVDRANTAWS
jgi:aerobic carbon-monoxide dehydrogenase medium subunit